MRRLASVLLWGGISALGAAGFGVLALSRGETVNAAWLLVAAVCTYAVAYRFYSRFLAARVFGLDERRATPAERFNNGRDFVPTNRWVLYGHHFAPSRERARWSAPCSRPSSASCREPSGS